MSDWQQQLARDLQRAPHDRHHPWRTPVLSTVDAHGQAQARTVVLRAVADDARTMHIYTDRRSPKVREIEAEGRVCLVLWNPRSSLQLRVSAQAHVLTQGPDVEAAWARMAQSPSRADYLSALAPGAAVGARSDPCPTPEADADADADPVKDHLDECHHLAVIVCRAQAWDALSLSREGHRRAVWRFDGAEPGAAGQWLTP